MIGWLKKKTNFVALIKNSVKMETYKFATTVLENGMIKIPELENYANQSIEVIVLLKTNKSQKNNINLMDEFLFKWGGFFSTVRTDDDKYNYLMEKYK